MLYNQIERKEAASDGDQAMSKLKVENAELKELVENQGNEILDNKNRINLLEGTIDKDVDPESTECTKITSKNFGKLQ